MNNTNVEADSLRDYENAPLPSCWGRPDWMGRRAYKTRAELLSEIKRITQCIYCERLQSCQFNFNANVLDQVLMFIRRIDENIQALKIPEMGKEHLALLERKRGN